MQIDKEKLQKLMNLSEDELKKKVTGALDASKLDKKDRENLNNALKSMKDIKKSLGNIDEESLKKAMNALGEDTIEEIKKNFGK